MFIILDPNIDGKTISGAQITYLDSLLNSTSTLFDNIFVFFYQVLWREHHPSIVPNSMVGRADSINFWTEVEPLFSILPNQVFKFSADFYVWTYATEVMYDRYNNICLIGSGIGGGAKGNFIVVNVGSNKQVCSDLICLENSNLDCLGPLSNHQVFINSADQKHELRSMIISPNPCSKALQLKLNQPI